MVDEDRACWEIDGHQLLLRIGDSLLRPDVNAVYGLVFDRTGEIDGRPVKAVDGAPPRGFSKYPARLKLRIFHDPAAGGAGLACGYRVEAGGAVTDLGPGERPDHVVMDGRWYPVVANAYADWDSRLLKIGVQPGFLPLRQYLELRKLASSDDVDDETAGAPEPPGAEVVRSTEALVGFRATLYPYQKSGWQWLSYIWQEGLGAILADEMGLGKTLQIIALLASPEREAAAPALIVAPTTLLENWRREIARFTTGLRVLVHQGPQRSGDYRSFAGYDVIVTSYDSVIRDGGMMGMIDWRIVVLDEAQAIKNPDTRRARAVKALRRRTGIAVTGTPVENRLRDLWSLADFAIPGYLGTLEDFERSFCDDEDGAARLEPLVSPVMLRRLVSDVARDLPEKIVVSQPVGLSESEAAAYETVRLETLAEYGASAALVALTRLRMFSAHPGMLEEGPISVQAALGFSKMARLFEIVDEVFARRQKILVFTSYNRVAEAIARVVRERYGAFADVINGETWVPERQGLVDAFSEEAGPALLALNPRAAGAGLNITAATCVVHYNLEWNPAIEDQASARAYRRGQERPVTIYRLFCADSVEEAVNDRLARKRDLANAAVVGVEGSEEDRMDIARALRMSPVGES